MNISDLLYDIFKEIIVIAVSSGLQYIISKIKNHSNGNESGLK